MKPCTEFDTPGRSCPNAGISGAGAAPDRGVGLASAAISANRDAAQQRTNDGRRLEPRRYSDPSLSRNLDFQKRKSLLFSRRSDSTHIMPKLAFTVCGWSDCRRAAGRNSSPSSLGVSWRNIAITLTIPQNGEWKAQAHPILISSVAGPPCEAE